MERNCNCAEVTSHHVSTAGIYAGQASTTIHEQQTDFRTNYRPNFERRRRLEANQEAIYERGYAQLQPTACTNLWHP